MVDERPTYGCGQVTAVVNRLRGQKGLPRVNHERVYRLMQRHKMLFAKHTGTHVPWVHDGLYTTFQQPLVLGWL